MTYYYKPKQNERTLKSVSERASELEGGHRWRVYTLTCSAESADEKIQTDHGFDRSIYIARIYFESDKVSSKILDAALLREMGQHTFNRQFNYWVMTYFVMLSALIAADLCLPFTSTAFWGWVEVFLVVMFLFSMPVVRSIHTKRALSLVADIDAWATERMPDYMDYKYAIEQVVFP